MFLRYLPSIALMIVFVATTTVANGQVGVAMQRPQQEFFQPVPAQPVDNSCWGGGSTPLGDLMRSVALGIQATGNFLFNNGQAAILQQQARGLAIDNDNRRYEFFAGIDARREERIAEKRQENELKRPWIFQNAYRLSSDQFDRQTGEIIWPLFLQADEFAGHRSQLESLFRRRIADGYSHSDTSADIRRHTKLLIAKLAKHRSEFIHDHDAKENYLLAQNFLRGLKYETSFVQ